MGHRAWRLSGGAASVPGRSSSTTPRVSTKIALEVGDADCQSTAMVFVSSTRSAMVRIPVCGPPVEQVHFASLIGVAVQPCTRPPSIFMNCIGTCGAAAPESCPVRT